MFKKKAMAADSHKNANIGSLSRKLKITGTIWLENCSLRSEAMYFLEYHSVRENNRASGAETTISGRIYHVPFKTALCVNMFISVMSLRINAINYPDSRQTFMKWII